MSGVKAAGLNLGRSHGATPDQPLATFLSCLPLTPHVSRLTPHASEGLAAAEAGVDFVPVGDGRLVHPPAEEDDAVVAHRGEVD